MQTMLHSSSARGESPFSESCKMERDLQSDSLLVQRAHSRVERKLCSDQFKIYYTGNLNFGGSPINTISLEDSEVLLIERALWRTGLSENEAGRRIKSYYDLSSVNHPQESMVLADRWKDPAIEQYSGEFYATGPSHDPRARLMKQLLEKCSSPFLDRSPIVMIRGDPGSGKSAILAEFVRIKADQCSGAKTFGGDAIIDPPESTAVCAYFYHEHLGSAPSMYQRLSAELVDRFLATRHTTGLQRTNFDAARLRRLAAAARTVDQQAAHLGLVIRSVLSAGCSVLLALDGLPHTDLVRATEVVLNVDRDVAALVRGAAVQCVLTSAALPAELRRLRASLLDLIDVPALSRAECRRICSLWWRAAARARDMDGSDGPGRTIRARALRGSSWHKTAALRRAARARVLARPRAPYCTN